MTTGLSDHVRCFHCGNGLHNWETSDIPWIEHARWYPDCYYVKITKGQEFIDKVSKYMLCFLIHCYVIEDLGNDMQCDNGLGIMYL